MIESHKTLILSFVSSLITGFAVQGVEVIVESNWFKLDLRPPITATATEEYLDWLTTFFSKTEIEDLDFVAEISDPDGDGYSNKFEFLAKMDPRDYEDRLWIIFSEVDKTRLSFWPLKEGVNFAVQYSLDLRTWANLEPTSYQFIETEVQVDLQSIPRAYYRILVSEPDL